MTDPNFLRNIELRDRCPLISRCAQLNSRVPNYVAPEGCCRVSLRRLASRLSAHGPPARTARLLWWRTPLPGHTLSRQLAGCGRHCSRIQCETGSWGRAGACREHSRCNTSCRRSGDPPCPNAHTSHRALAPAVYQRAHWAAPGPEKTGPLDRYRAARLHHSGVPACRGLPPRGRAARARRGAGLPGHLDSA